MNGAPGGRGLFLITCEHGGNRIPPPYLDCFAGQEALIQSHRGYDPGALTMARELARALAAPLIYSTISRLLVDLNRSPGHPRLHAEAIRALPDTVRHEIVRKHYLPFRSRAERAIRHAIEAGHRVINLSLSTTKRRFAESLHELADVAYFNRSVIVASAHNMPVDSYPWRFSSVISVGSHEDADPLAWYANPSPPVELFARGVDVDVAWLGGGTLRCTGNSFAAPHIAGIAALVLAKHSELTPFQLKSVLHLTASNTREAP